MTFRRLHVIIVECGEININVITYTEKVCVCVCVCVNYKNVNNEIIAPDCAHEELRTNGVTLGIELRSFLPN